MSFSEYEVVWRLPPKQLLERAAEWWSRYEAGMRAGRWRNPGEIYIDVLAAGGTELPKRVQPLGKGRELVEYLIPQGLDKVVRAIYVRTENGVINVLRIQLCRVKRENGRVSLDCKTIEEMVYPKRAALTPRQVRETAEKVSKILTQI